MVAASGLPERFFQTFISHSERLHPPIVAGAGISIITVPATALDRLRSPYSRQIAPHRFVLLYRAENGPRRSRLSYDLESSEVETRFRRLFSYLLLEHPLG